MPDELIHKSSYVYIGIFFIIGIFILQDFGFSWDEELQRQHGIVTVSYVNDLCGKTFFEEEVTKEWLPEYHSRYYGMIFQMMAYPLERVMDVSDFRSFHYLRHYVLFTLFCISLIFFVKYGIQYFGPVSTILALILLSLHPRIFSHVFYNTKDIVLLSLYIIAGYTLLKCYTSRNVKWAVIHGLATALAINGRITGVYVLGLSLMVFGYMYMRERKMSDFRLASIYGLVSIALTYVFWPSLWMDPIGEFWFAFESMSKFGWENLNLLNGEFHKASERPFSYPFIWMGITTPLLFLVIILLGIVGWGMALGRSSAVWRMEDSITIGLFLGPLVIIQILNATLYDGWRHLYFIYPFLVIFSIKGVGLLMKNYRPWFKVSIPIIAAYAIFILVKWHPLQSSFFNPLAAKPYIENYDVEYWGQGYLALHKMIAESDTSKLIKVHGVNYPGWKNRQMLLPEVGSRFQNEQKLENSDYFLTNYRFENELDLYLNRSFPYNRPAIHLKRNGQIILSAYHIERRPDQNN